MKTSSLTISTLTVKLSFTNFDFSFRSNGNTQTQPTIKVLLCVSCYEHQIPRLRPARRFYCWWCGDMGLWCSQINLQLEVCVWTAAAVPEIACYQLCFFGFFVLVVRFCRLLGWGILLSAVPWCVLVFCWVWSCFRQPSVYLASYFLGPFVFPLWKLLLVLLSFRELLVFLSPLDKK